MLATTKENQRALSEVFDILSHTEKELLQKISKKFIKYVYDNMDKDYRPKLDYSDDIYTQNIMNETIAILSIIYRDYLCSKEEKQAILKKDREQLAKIKQDKTNQYDVDPFGKHNQSIESKTEIKENDSLSNSSQVSLILVKEEKWYSKIINKIRNFFKIKNK